MNGIKRYDHVSYGMVIDPNGEYVTHYEFEKVVASVASRATEQIDSIKEVHKAEVARLRADLQNAAKAALDAVALSCEKEREADALRVDAERYRWLRNPDRNVSLVLDKVTGYVEYHEGTQTGGYSTYEYRAGEELDSAIDEAMGADA